MFIISAELYIFGALVYLILAQGERQWWAGGKRREEKGNEESEESSSIVVNGYGSFKETATKNYVTSIQKEHVT